MTELRIVESKERPLRQRLPTKHDSSTTWETVSAKITELAKEVKHLEQGSSDNVCEWYYGWVSICGSSCWNDRKI